MLPCREDTLAVLLDDSIGRQHLQLRKQHIALGDHELCLIQPADVDAVIDMYLAAGMSLPSADHDNHL